jgi:hypothetical protein
MPLNKLELLKLFKDKTVEFLDALIEKLPKERDLYMVRVLFETQIPVEKAMQSLFLAMGARCLAHAYHTAFADQG